MRLFLFSLLLSVSLAAQTDLKQQAVADIRLVNQAYLATANLRMNVQYTLFSNYSTTVPFDNEQGVFMKQGVNTYSNLLGIVSIRNSRMSLTLDSNEQSIVVADPPTKNDLNPSLVNLDSIMKFCSSVQFHETAEKQRFYKLKFDNAQFFEYDAMDIYINSQTHFLEKLVLYFRAESDLDESDDNIIKDRPRLEISYSGITTAPVFSAGQFSESAFVSGSGSKLACTPRYSHYRLVNNKLK